MPKTIENEFSPNLEKPPETLIGRGVFAFFKNAFNPPYRTLPWLVWFAVVWSFCLSVKSLFLGGYFYDTDDYMRFVQVFHWIDGASWYDLNIPRLDPPHGMVMHWTRLADIPLAALQKLQEMAGLPRLAAAQITAFFVPAALMLLLFLLLPGMARPFLPRGQARLVVLVLPFFRYLQFNFSPGRVDHHDYMELIAGYGFMALVRMYLVPSSRFWPVTAGILAALSLWVGAEGLIGLTLVCGALTALWVLDGVRMALPARRFGLSLLAACCVLLPVARRPAEWLATDYDTFSLFYVAIAAAVAGYFLFMACACVCKRPWQRLVCALVAGGVLAAVLLKVFPDFVHGPYGRVDPRFAAFFFDGIQEAMPLYKVWNPLRMNIPAELQNFGLPLIGLFFVAGQIWRHRKSAALGRLWLLSLWYLTFPLLLAFFWEQRTQPYAELFSVIPVAVLLVRVWRLIRARREGATRYWLQLAAFILLGPLFPVLLPAFARDLPFRSDVLFYPAQPGPPVCDKKELAALLRTSLFSDRVYLILTTMDDGPELLFRTPHDFIAAPYHRDARGDLDAVAILGNGDDRKAETLARARRIDLIAVCKSFPDTYLSPDGKGNPLARMGTMTIKNGKMERTLSKNAALIQRLAQFDPPDWLAPIPIALNSDYRLYRVKPLAPLIPGGNNKPLPPAVTEPKAGAGK